MTSVCNEEDDEQVNDEWLNLTLLCVHSGLHYAPDDFEHVGKKSILLLCRFARKAMKSERDTAIRQLSTRSPRAEPLLRQSLFKNFPPSIIFYKREKKNLDIVVKKPSGYYKCCFKWCQSSLLSQVMKRTLKTSHFELVPSESSEWRGFWGKHLRTAEYKTLTYWQKVNHFPGDFHIGRKDRLWQHLTEMARRFPGFDIMPKTYILPKDYNRLCEYLENSGKHVIVKPPASARGRGITIVDKIEMVPLDEPIIAQHYVDSPLCIQGSKFDLRLYVYVSSLNPLLVYIYNDGLVRFASVPYDANDSYNNQYMHLTNFSINKMAKKNGITDTNVSELKWPLEKFWEFVRNQGRDPDELWKRIKDIAVKSIIACASSIRKQQMVFCAFPFLNREIFGMDILIDSDFKPWILEMNISPSMQTATEEDTKVKAPLIANLLNMWRVEFVHKNDVDAVDQSYRCKPIEIHKGADHMAKEAENLDFYIRTGKICPEILSQLTDADLRYLMDFEDEFALRGNFDLIYPAADTIANYLPCMEPIYANLLLTAWISLNDRERKIGFERLKTLSEKGAHLSEEGFVDDDESVVEDNKFSDYVPV